MNLNIPISEKFYHNKQVLVAGGTGTIGTPLVHLLCQLGAQVKVVSMDSAQYAHQVLPGNVQFERLDLTNFENCLKACSDMEYVFNLVGIKGSVGIGQSKVASYLVPYLWFQTNLMEAAFRKKAQRFMFVGSICSYPQSALPKLEEKVWDGMPLQNDRIPGLAKRIGEIQAEAYLLEHKWEAVRIVRPSNVYGPFDDFNPASAQVIPALISRVLAGENPLTVWGDGSAQRDFIYSEELAAWLLLALEKAPPCLPLNLGAGRAVTIKEIAETVVNCLEQPVPIKWLTDKPTGDAVRVLSIEKARALIQFAPQTSLKEGIKKTMQWYKSNKDLSAKKNVLSRDEAA